MQIALAGIDTEREPTPQYRVFYRINILNHRQRSVRLLGRKWVLTDTTGDTRIIEAARLFNEENFFFLGHICIILCAAPDSDYIRSENLCRLGVRGEFGEIVYGKLKIASVRGYLKSRPLGYFLYIKKILLIVGFCVYVASPFYESKSRSFCDLNDFFGG